MLNVKERDRCTGCGRTVAGGWRYFRRGRMHVCDACWASPPFAAPFQSVYGGAHVGAIGAVFVTSAAKPDALIVRHV